MNLNKWIKASSKLYNFLLRLYPKVYREEFSNDMQQVFRDECRNRYETKGLLGIFLYWFKVLPDLMYTALMEHITSPTATLGLMEPVPNAPLPWKGVLLVLLPGFVYLVAQISQFTGKFWYVAVYYRAGLFLMIPVVVVWAITKRFPIWGLIPVGLFYHFLDAVSFSTMYYLENLNIKNGILRTMITFVTGVWNTPLILLIMMGVLIFLLLRNYRKNFPQSNDYLYWLAAFGVLAVLYNVYSVARMANILFSEVSIKSIHQYLIIEPNAIYWQLYEFFVVILLVSIGTLFLKRHGFFSIFVYVGYLLPERLIGYPWNVDELIDVKYAMFAIGFAVIAYRVLLSLVAPIWMSRMVSQNKKRKAITLTILIAVLIGFVSGFYQQIFLPQFGGVSLQMLLFTIIGKGNLLLGFFMAVSLCQEKPLASMLEKFETKAEVLAG